MSEAVADRISDRIVGILNDERADGMTTVAGVLLAICAVERLCAQHDITPPNSLLGVFLATRACLDELVPRLRKEPPCH